MRRRAVLTALGLALALLSCEHAQPFDTRYTEPDVPYDPAFPRRLTFNGAEDVAPAWLPDGSGIMYSYQVPQPDSEQCLGILPAEGGHLTWSACPAQAPLAADSTRVLTQPAVGPAGVLVYLRENKQLGTRDFVFKDLVVASLADPVPGRVVLSLAYWAPDSLLHVAVQYLRWLDAHTLVWVAVVDTVEGPPPVPSEIVRLDVSTMPATMTVLGGTGGASSVAADSGGALYYTLRGDTHVYRYAAGERPDTVCDFGAAGSPTGVQVHGNVLVADVAGTLYRVDLASGALAPIASAGLVLDPDPALSPSGTRVVVQARADSAALANRDLWLLQVP